MNTPFSSPFFASRFTALALCASLGALGLLPLAGCQKVAPLQPQPKDYWKKLGDGQSGLRKLSPNEIPDMGEVMAQYNDGAFRQALARSVAWYAKKSAAAKFPRSTISFEKASASASAFKTIVETSSNKEEAIRRIREQFDVYASVGCDDQGSVLFTGYHSPIYSASPTKTAQFQNPIYKRPADLAAGEADAAHPYATRGELYDSGKLNGLEFVFLPDPLDAYAIEVNGSAKLRMPDGKDMYVGFHGINGQPYTSIGKLLVADGKIPANHISMQSIRAYFAAHPGELQGYIRRNDRLPFFTEYSADIWPGGCLGFQVTGQRTLATDKSVFPPASVVWVQTGGNNATGTIKPINQLMLDQDAGGAIRAAGRADLYFGTGPEAEKWAGDLAVEGKLYYFFLKDEFMPKAGK